LQVNFPLSAEFTGN